jgi:dihydrofolate reductase
MRINLLVAADEKNGIGYKGQLPWRLPTDLRRFKELTMGHTLILGRKTYESIGRPLPGRVLIIVTRNPAFRAEGCLITHSVAEALEVARQRGEKEAFICGGGEIYRQTLHVAGRLYLTRLHAQFQVDTFLPEIDLSAWDQVSAEFHESDEEHPFPFTFFIYQR